MKKSNFLPWQGARGKKGHGPGAQFLALAGYTLEDGDRLMRDIREQLLPLDAEFHEETEYGPKYRIRGTLTGPNGQVLRVLTIWMKEGATNQTKFVRLFPDKL